MIVMPGLDPGICIPRHEIAGSSPAMTIECHRLMQPMLHDTPL
jgi:hypothetical protein